MYGVLNSVLQSGTDRVPYARDVTENSDSRAVNPTTQTYLVATAYPKHIVKLGQPKPARAPNRMVCTGARSAWALCTIGRAVLCDAHSRE